MREADIMYEMGDYWVGRDKSNNCYTVYKSGLTHSTPDSSYALTDDGLSIAKVRCKYLAKVKP